MLWSVPVNSLYCLVYKYTKQITQKIMKKIFYRTSWKSWHFEAHRIPPPLPSASPTPSTPTPPHRTSITVETNKSTGTGIRGIINPLPYPLLWESFLFPYLVVFADLSLLKGWASWQLEPQSRGTLLMRHSRRTLITSVDIYLDQQQANLSLVAFQGTLFL